MEEKKRKSTAEEKLTMTQRTQMDGIDGLPHGYGVIMGCDTCRIRETRLMAPLEGKRFILEHAGHQTHYRRVPIAGMKRY